MCMENGEHIERCFSCGRKLGKKKPHLVDTRDCQTVYVGPECYRKIKAAGEAGHTPDGWKPGMVRLYPLT
jgi:hypothetical protein